ncbi:unnamed protein product [Blepharisma stoltei]|uniref:Uncharacterized protein n=1 Tax=Blepharisma stoltei TaxID=1481888 RepID=A0AAU9JPE6_9CILI|nr:unnamed protein product [Blepharisma stoltei]
MSRKVNDYVIDDVIQGIKNTLQKHSSSFKGNSSKNSLNATPERSRDLSLRISSIESSQMKKLDNIDLASSRHISPNRVYSESMRPFRSESTSINPIISPDKSASSEVFQKYLNSGPKSPLGSDSIRGLSSRLESIPSPRNKNLEITFKEQSQELENLFLAKERLETELQESKFQLSDLMISKDNQINELLIKLQDALGMNEMLRKEKFSIEQELNSLKNCFEEIRDVTSSANDLERRISILHSENRGLSNENMSFKQNLKILETEMNYKDTKIAALNEEIAVLKKLNGDFEDKVLEFKREQFSALKENDELKTKIKEKDRIIEDFQKDKKDLEDRLNNMKELLRESAEARYLGKTYNAPLKMTNEDVKGWFSVKGTPKGNFSATDDFKNSSRPRSLSKSRKRSSSIGDITSPKSYGFHGKRDKSPLHKHSSKSSITSATKSKIIRDLQDVVMELQELFSVSNPNKVVSAAYDLKKVNEQLLNFIGEVREIICRELNIESKHIEMMELLKLTHKIVDEVHAGKHCRTVLDKLVVALDIKSVDDLPKTITDILKETENLLLILNKVKAIFRLDYRISLSELETEIDKRL